LTLETLLARYGYAAIFFGAILEGETVLLVAAAFVQQGLLDFEGVLLASTLGAFAGDQFFFHLGRCKGAELMGRYPAWQRKLDQALGILARRREIVVLFYRFIYGMRAVIPFLLGSGRCRVLAFTLLSALSAVVWAVLIGAGGYYCGAAFATMLQRGRGLQQGALLGLILLVSVVAALRWCWKRRPQRPSNQPPRG
jgi:membrane protein DedA with SNARE-associated domain